MIDCIKKLLFQYFVKNLYRKYEPYYFPIMSKPPKFLNYAYPEFSVQYFLTTFSKNETVTITGIIPKTKLNFYSITLYEKNGLPYYSKNDYNIHITKEDDKFIFYQERLTILDTSALIVRFYVKNEYNNENFYYYLPDISPIKKNDFENMEKNSIEVGTILQNRIEEQNNVNSDFLKNTLFFKPSREKLNNLFPNANAEYLIAFPKTFVSIIRIKTEKFTKDDFRFIGFMASNYKTTATDSSVSLEVGEKEYKIWVCYQKDLNIILSHFSYNNSDLILCWNDENRYPILVYREVRIQKKGLQKINMETKEDELRKIMNYPEIEYL